MKHFKIKEVKPGIFLFSFKDYYEMGMHFLRYQEYYESPSAKFRGKSFTILDFMSWYVKQRKTDVFTYCRDWGGYNFPAQVISNVRKLKIPDPNFYDGEMLKAFSKCLTKSNGQDFYIIGAVGEGETLNHEVAHGLYYLNSEYKKEMNRLVAELPKSVIKKVNEWLKSVGYTSKVYKDETQAYFATGLPEALDSFKKYQKPFKALYKTFM